jgi:integrase
MAKFYYHLRQTYKDGVTIEIVNNVIRPLIKQGKSVKDYLNKKETSIYIAATLCGRFFKWKTDYLIQPIYWDSEKQQVKQAYHNSMVVNDGLVLLKQRVEARYRAALNENPNIMLSEILDIIKGAVNGSKPSQDPKGFFEAYEEFIEEKRKVVKPNTIKRLISQRNLLLEFEKKYYPIKFYKINSTFEVDLNHFYSHDKQHYNNTIAKNIALLKTFLNWAVEKKIHNYRDYEKFTIKENACEVIYLTEDELMRLYSLDLENKPSLARARDRWVLAAFTGQRHSDIKAFSYDSIQFVDGGYEWWLFQVKGNKAKKVVVPLSNDAMAIIRKYPRTINRKAILPPLSDTNANKYIKEVCKLAKIDEIVPLVKYSGKKRIEIVLPKYEHITMHTARKTFVTLSIEKGLSPEHVMEITGHEDYDTMKKYMSISQKAVKRAFIQIWNNGKPNDGGLPTPSHNLKAL